MIRMWVFEQDRYGMTENSFSVNNPAFIPRVGEYIESPNSTFFGKVETVEYHYRDECGDYSLVVTVFLEKQND